MLKLEVNFMELGPDDFTTEQRDPPPGLIAVHKATGLRAGPVLRVLEEEGMGERVPV